ncbi:MAG TPA: hypothetical protein EYP14_10180, partial [Planctomycetaceae bacterium]|nr:hypothetical protein [Planctomycetaceae bacterium]
MMVHSLFLHLAGFAALSLVGCYLLTGLVRHLSYRTGLLDRPDGGRKAHREPTPLMGGLAIFLSVLLAALAAAWLNPAWLAADPSWGRVFPTLLISAGAICLVGLWDDKHAMRPRTKFAWQVIAAVPWALAGRVLEPIQVAGISVDLGGASFPFVVLWLVACANVINL